MADDDLDLDLELEAEAAQPKRRGLFGRRKKAATAPNAGAGGGATDSAAAPAQAGKKPGFLARFVPTGEAAGGKRSPWNLKTFIIGLLALVVVLLVVENWSPARVNFIGLHADLPKSVLIVIDFALGFGTAWWIFRRRGASQTSK